MKMKELIWSFAVLALFSLPALNLTSCSSDDDDDDVLKAQTLYAGDSVKWKKGATSANDFVAYVSKGGYIHAYHVGTTTVAYKGDVATVTVYGRYNALNVQTDWGLTPELLKKRQGGTPVQDYTKNGNRAIIYQNVGKANLLMYIFSNNKLVSATVYSSRYDEDAITNYLSERYVFSTQQYEDDTFIGFLGMDALEKSKIKTAVLYGLDSDYKLDYMLQTMFMSYAYLSKSSNVRAEVRNLAKQMPKKLLILK